VNQQEVELQLEWAERGDKIEELLAKLSDSNSRIAELEAQVEGLGIENTEWETEIEGHKTRYRAAIDMVERRQAALNTAVAMKRNVTNSFLKLRAELIRINESVAALTGVPLEDLDSAVSLIHEEIERALR
jgi:chromosome segregation ATPase